MRLLTETTSAFSIPLTSAARAHRAERKPAARAWTLAAAVVSLASWTGAQAVRAPTARLEPMFAVVDLGTLPGSPVCPCSFGVAIGNGGHVVGRFFGTTGGYRGFLWSNGVMTDLGSLGGDVTQVLAVNAQGVAAGLSRTTAGTEHAFVFAAGALRDLGTLGGANSVGRAINDAGVVAGNSQRHGRDDFMHATVWAAGVTLDLGTLGGAFSDAFGINATGQVVGWAWDPARRQRAFLWTPAAGMMDLGDLGAGSAGAVAINDAGVIVGAAQAAGQPAGTTHAFRWSSGVMTDLGVLPEAGRQGPFGPELVNTAAAGINGAGQIVGNSYPGSPEPPLRPGPFLWRDGVMTNLNDLIDPTSGWILMESNGINDRGQITGTARSAAGEIRAVLLQPAVF